MITDNCPVPKEQIPIEEYKELTKSWFFSLPFGHQTSLSRALLLSWLIAFPLIFTISANNLIAKKDLIKLTLNTSTISILIPIVLLLRLLLGWKYIQKRLTNKTIIYEETGWQDGNSWCKPKEWIEKDLLVAQHEVKPVIKKVIRSIKISWALIIMGLIFSMAFSNLNNT